MLTSLLADLDGDGSIAILVARRGERLAAPGAAHRIAGAARADGRGVEFLVNNAGFGAIGTVADMPAERALGMLQVNVMALSVTWRARTSHWRNGCGACWRRSS